MKFALAVFILAVLIVSGAPAQTAAPAHVTVAGTITEVNASANQVGVKSERFAGAPGICANPSTPSR